MDLEHLDKLTTTKRISLFGKVIKEQQERELEEMKVIPTEKVEEYKPIHKENEKHLETIFAHEGEEGQLL